jgi:holo-[acyl-carrier protein] synthase
MKGEKDLPASDPGDEMGLAPGVDIVEVERIRQALERWGDRFLRRVFTAGEIEYCRRKRRAEQSYAVRYAAKEAVLKALGLGKRWGIRWTDLEVVNDRMGKPEMRFGGRMREILGDRKVLISLTHTREHAVAMALLIDDRGEDR